MMATIVGQNKQKHKNKLHAVVGNKTIVEMYNINYNRSLEYLLRELWWTVITQDCAQGELQCL